MKKGMTFFYGHIATPEKRFEAIKNAGFDCVILNADPNFDYQNGKFKKQIKLCKKYGIGFSSLHFRYIKQELPEFWKPGKIGDRLAKNLIKDIKIAKKYGFSCVVVHLAGEVNQIGYDRLDKALKLCEKFNVPLAFENLSANNVLFDVMEHYKNNPYVKFCYDIGHHNIYDRDFDFIKEYGNRLACFHLHDNQGLTDNPIIDSKGKPVFDEHTLNKYGTIDWDKFARKIAKLKNIPPLDYEIIYKVDHGDSLDEIPKETFNQAQKLEKLINNYRNNKNTY